MNEQEILKRVKYKIGDIVEYTKDKRLYIIEGYYHTSLVRSCILYYLGCTDYAPIYVEEDDLRFVERQITFDFKECL